MLVMLSDKNTRNVLLLSTPSDHVARGVPTQDALARTPLWSTMMKPYPSANGHWDPKQANGNDSGQLALSPQVLICPPTIQWSLPSLTGAKTKPPEPPRQDSPVPSLPREQTPRQPTPGPSGTRWSEELFREPS
ncbi:hypothetical protein O181_094125 [Austropuccinia psidii MF-1]|uniref:Uncharacterized protein n=1 Tax=Austropuccinia psidii MF-1 TaxID=1389203 RepID=A0A9Q3J306_9BASI|nr:hypothetical protein [Austropuccinia psidii MF-1]